MNFSLTTGWKTLISVLCGAAAIAASPAAESDPVLKQDDMIRMSVFEEPELSANSRILKSGEVVLPLLAEVKIGGLTVSEANKKIRDLYISEKYLVDPKVMLTVEEYSKGLVEVIGEVGTQGAVPFPANDKLDLMGALATAGGLNPVADPNRIVLTRADGKTSTHAMASLQAGAIVPLQPGDRIRVDKSFYANKFVTVVGQVGRKGRVAFPLDGKFDLVSAINAAGGFTDLSNPKNVKINRKGEVITRDVKAMTDKGDKPYLLQPDDIITVAERLF